MSEPAFLIPEKGSMRSHEHTAFDGSRLDFEELIAAWDERNIRLHVEALGTDLALCVDAMVATYAALMSWRERGELSLQALACWSFGHAALQAAVFSASQIARGHYLTLPATLRMLGESEGMMILMVSSAEYARLFAVHPEQRPPNAFGLLTRKPIVRELHGSIGFSVDAYRKRTRRWRALSNGSHANLFAIELTTRREPPSSSILGGEWDAAKLPGLRNAVNIIRSVLMSVHLTADRAAAFLTPTPRD